MRYAAENGWLDRFRSGPEVFVVEGNDVQQDAALDELLAISDSLPSFSVEQWSGLSVDHPWDRWRLRWRMRVLQPYIDGPFLRRASRSYWLNRAQGDDQGRRRPESALWYEALGSTMPFEVDRALRRKPALETDSVVWTYSGADGGTIALFTSRGPLNRSRHSAVRVSFPDKGVPFLLTGLTSVDVGNVGVNRAGLALLVHTARVASEPNENDRLLSTTMQSVLGKCSDLECGARLLSEWRTNPAATFVLAHRDERRVLVAECTPSCVVEQATSTMAQSNHLRGKRAIGDPDNDYVRRFSSSGSRYLKLKRAWNRGRRRVRDVAGAVNLLRELPLEAKSHSIPWGRSDLIGGPGSDVHVFALDLGRWALWIGSHRGFWGRMNAIDLREYLRLGRRVGQRLDSIQPSAVLRSEVYHRWILARRLLRRSSIVAKKGDGAGALMLARRGVELWSADPWILETAARRASDVGDDTLARRWYEMLVAQEPGDPSVSMRAREWLELHRD